MNLNIKKTIGLFSLLVVLIQSPCFGFLDDDDEIMVKSPTPGIIRHIAVVSGQQVKRGDILFEIEAMKMLNSIRAPRPGFIGPLDFMVNQLIEKDMPLVAILPFIPEGENIDPMDKDKSPLPIVQDKEPFVKDIPQKDDLREVAESLTNSLTIDEVPDVSLLEVENEIEVTKMPISINASKLIFIGPLNHIADQVVEKDMSLVAILPFIPKGENIDPTDKDEPPLPTFQDKEPLVKDIPQKKDLREVTEPLTRSLTDKADVSSILQKAKAEELGQRKSNTQTPAHFPWLEGFMLLGVLFFCRSRPITPYCVKNVLSPEVAVNWNIPRYFRDVA